MNVSVLCTAAFLTALFPSFGAEMANSIDRARAPISAEHQLFAQSGLGSDKQSPTEALAGAAFLDDDSPLGNRYLVQARSDDIVICSFVGKVVMCHRIVRSCPPRLLLPRRLPREQRRNKLLLGPYRC
ncbi:MAG TPA: hypothetical protein VG291_07070 [Xanthobacteraceae bacterium]|nr:hypothetical protein [Xanthobacteraceae bacterium]